MAHLEKEGYRDYRNNWYWQTMANFRRVVDLWGDDYKQTFFDFVPDIEVRRNNVEQRQCPRVQRISAVAHNGFPRININNIDESKHV